MINEKNIIFIVLVLIGLGIYIIMKKNNIELLNNNNSNYTEKSIWRVNTMLKIGEERVSPNGLVKIYVKVADTDDNHTGKMIGLWRKNPNKTDHFLV